MKKYAIVEVGVGDSGQCDMDCDGLRWQWDTEPHRIWPECTVFKCKTLSTSKTDMGTFAVRCSECVDAVKKMDEVSAMLREAHSE